MRRDATKDLTKGNILSAILSFAIPLFFGMFFQQLYNLFDTIIVGKTLGVEALSGVGSTGSINFFVIGFCNGVAAGCCIPIAQNFGANDFSNLRKYLANAFYLGIIFVIFLTLTSCLLCNQILVWMKTLPSVYHYAYDYIFYIFLGIPITFAYNLFSGVIRSLGDSKAPVLFLIIGTVTNIFLDIFFMGVLKKGVSFAAFATLISQFFAATLCLIYMWTHFKILHIKKEERKFSLKRIGTLLWMGIPMGLQYSITAIGSILITSSVNSLNSTIYVAAVTSASKISAFFCCPFDALGSTMATFGGQNVGARQYERLKNGLKCASVIGIFYSLFALFILWIFGGNLSMIFIDEYNPEIITATKQMLFINACFYIPLVFVNVVRFLLQGMGYSFVAVLAGVLEMIGRMVVALFFVSKYGFLAVCFASPVAWILADLFLIPTFLICQRKMIRNKNKVQQSI